MTSDRDIPALVYLAGVGWDDVPGTDHHMVRCLSEHLPVVWVDPPMSMRAELRHGSSRPALRPILRLVAPGVVRVTTAVPAAPSRIGVRSVAAAIEGGAIRRALREHQWRACATIVSSPEPRSVLHGARPCAYFATDDFTAGAGLIAMPMQRLRHAERQQVAHADVVFAVTDDLAQRWRSSRTRVVTLPNGCHADHYALTDTLPRRPEVALSAPVAGVVGQLSDRLDISYLEAVVDQGVSLLLVGPLHPVSDGVRWQRLLARQQVVWVGRQPFDALPSYLRLMDVGLTPYADTAFNRASFPLKTLEYLAAGRAVVSTDLPAVHWLQSPDVHTATSPDQYARSALALARAPVRPADRARRRAFAAQHDWSVRAATLLDELRTAGAELRTAT